VARALLGLDIGTSAVRAAQVSRKTDPPTLERFATVPLPRGAVAGGEIVDAAAVADAVRELLRRGRLGAKRTAIGVANQKVVVRQVELPAMEEAELRSALQFQAQEHIPIPIEEAILDFQILEESLTPEGDRTIKVLLVAAQRDMVSAFVSVGEKAGLDVAAVDLSPFAAVRAVGSTAPLLGTRESEAIVDVGAGVTTIVVHEHGTPQFVRILPMGGDDITEALAAALQVGWEEAEAIKARLGVPPEGGLPGDDAARIIEGQVGAFVEELRGSIDYYLSQPGASRIATVVATGGGSRLPGLLERLTAALHLPVEEGQPLARVRLGALAQTPEELARLSSTSAVALGLALREP
jgi:type IV pilus assembly protein PilM